MSKKPHTYTKEQHSRTAYDNTQTYGYNRNKGLITKTPFNIYANNNLHIVFMCTDECALKKEVIKQMLFPF